MLIGATLAFVFLIAGSIYAVKLYITSQDTYVKKDVYNTKDPSVSFDSFKSMHEDEISSKNRKIAEIEAYVLQTIQKGSSGHGYSLGSMPQGLIKDKNAKEVASFIANKLKGNKPQAFGACVACHGNDGKGLNGQSPSLLTLPIYNGLVGLKKDNEQKIAPSESTTSQKHYSDPLKNYSAKLASIVNQYALTVGQDGTTVDDMHKDIKSLSINYNSDTFSLLQTQLSENLKNLLIYGKNLAKNKKKLADAIKWQDVIKWVVDNFDRQLKEEDAKYQDSLDRYHRLKNGKLSKAQSAKMELYQVATALGVALIVFILLTMILVLFQIEINTRPQEEDIEVKE